MVRDVSPHPRPLSRGERGYSRSQAPLGNGASEALLRLLSARGLRHPSGFRGEAELRFRRSQAELGNEMARDDEKLLAVFGGLGGLWMFSRVSAKTAILGRDEPPVALQKMMAAYDKHGRLWTFSRIFCREGHVRRDGRLWDLMASHGISTAAYGVE